MVDIFSLSLQMKKLSIEDMKSFAQSHTARRILPLESIACTVHTIPGCSVSVRRLSGHVTEVRGEDGQGAWGSHRTAAIPLGSGESGLRTQ